jgi:hypothetical protein
MSKKNIAEYSQKLDQSDFYISLVSAIKKYVNKTLHIKYVDDLLNFVLIDQFGQHLSFSQLSD